LGDGGAPLEPQSVRRLGPIRGPGGFKRKTVVDRRKVRGTHKKNPVAAQRSEELGLGWEGGGSLPWKEGPQRAKEG